MKLSISNIAWGALSNSRIFGFLQDQGIQGIEFAPGLIQTSIPRLKSTLDSSGMKCVGFHALFYEYPDWRVVKQSDWPNAISLLSKYANYCAELGGNLLVLGSPPFRRLEECSYEDAIKLFMEFLVLATNEIDPTGVKLLIEPLPKAELISNSYDGIELIKTINHQALSLHLDTRTLHTQNENLSEIIPAQAKYLEHVHTGGINLTFISPQDVINHKLISHALHEINYTKFITLEMVRPSDSPNYNLLEKTINYAKSIYKTQ